VHLLFLLFHFKFHCIARSFRNATGWRRKSWIWQWHWYWHILGTRLANEGTRDIKPIHHSNSVWYIPVPHNHSHQHRATHRLKPRLNNYEAHRAHSYFPPFGTLAFWQHWTFWSAQTLDLERAGEFIGVGISQQVAFLYDTPFQIFGLARSLRAKMHYSFFFFYEWCGCDCEFVCDM
jgi:hypothetical protein